MNNQSKKIAFDSRLHSNGLATFYKPKTLTSKSSEGHQRSLSSRLNVVST